MAPALWGFLLVPLWGEQMETEDNVIDELVREISGLIHEYPKVLERRAADIHASGKDPELAQTLVKAADTMRDSGNLYLTWARSEERRVGKECRARWSTCDAQN